MLWFRPGLWLIIAWILLRTAILPWVYLRLIVSWILLRTAILPWVCLWLIVTWVLLRTAILPWIYLWLIVTSLVIVVTIPRAYNTGIARILPLYFLPECWLLSRLSATI